MASCKTCSGRGSLKCPKCNGKGAYYQSGGPFSGGSVQQCKNCHGSGMVRCGVCGGKGQLK